VRIGARDGVRGERKAEEKNEGGERVENGGSDSYRT